MRGRWSGRRKRRRRRRMWGRCSRRGEGDAGEVLGEVFEEEDAREVKKHNACVLGVRWGEVGRVKKKRTRFWWPL